MSTIKNIWGREILDSRGLPTIEVACQSDSGAIAVSSVPAGTSTGSHEALELRDNDPTRYKGYGVLKAIALINTDIAKVIIGQDPTQQNQIDQTLIKMDGTANKSKLGSNAILAVSQVVAKLASNENKVPLYRWINTLYQAYEPISPKIPIPSFNMINGGLHGAGNLDFQEFHLNPASNKSFSEGLRMCVEIYITLKNLLEKRGAIHSVGDEGGFAPNLFTNLDALEILFESVRESNYAMGRDISMSLDVAASEFFANNVYKIKDKTAALDENSLIEYYKVLNAQYHLSSIEDPLNEDAWEGWAKLTKELGSETVIIGDDFLVTDIERVKKAIEKKSCNGVLIKPNQIGTISETFEVIKLARSNKWEIKVSHRSGETNDWFIADFAVGVAADTVKFGGPCRGERVAKYNRLLSIEQEFNLTQK
jgi:enolase